MALRLRREVFGALLPHEAASVEHLAHHLDFERLRVSDVFTVVRELRHRGTPKVAYPSWVATSWQILGWPEPSARLFWEMTWLVGDEVQGGLAARGLALANVAVSSRKAFDARLEPTDLGLFLLLHCRHDAGVRDDAPSVFEEAWIESAAVQDLAAGDTPPASPPTSPRTHRGSKHASLDLCLGARAKAEAARASWIRDRAEIIARIVSTTAESPDIDDTGDRILGTTKPSFRVLQNDADRLEFLFRVVDKKKQHDWGTTPTKRRRKNTSSPNNKGRRRRRRLSEQYPAFHKGEADGEDFTRWLAGAILDDDLLFAGKMFGSETKSPSGQGTRSFACSASQAADDGTIAIVDARRCTRVVVDDDDDDGDVTDEEDDDDDVDMECETDEDDDDDEDSEGKPLLDCRVVGCRDAKAYILTATRYVDVVGCSDCLVVVGAVARLVRVIACERTHVVAAAGRALVSSCLGCRLSIYSPFAPLLDGDNRSCRVAPLAVVYDGYRNHVRLAGLLGGASSDETPRSSSRRLTVESPLSSRGIDTDADFAAATIAAQNAAGAEWNSTDDDEVRSARSSMGDVVRRRQTDHNLWRVPLRLAAAVHRGADLVRVATESLALPPADFDLLTTFATHETQLPFPLPPDYAAALDLKREKANALRDRLNASDDPNLHAVVKAAFAKWLVDSRAIRHVADLVVLDDDRSSSFVTPHTSLPTFSLASSSSRGMRQHSSSDDDTKF